MQRMTGQQVNGITGSLTKWCILTCSLSFMLTSLSLTLALSYTHTHTLTKFFPFNFYSILFFYSNFLEDVLVCSEMGSDLKPGAQWQVLGLSNVQWQGPGLSITSKCPSSTNGQNGWSRQKFEPSPTLSLWGISISPSITLSLYLSLSIHTECLSSQISVSLSHLCLSVILFIFLSKYKWFGSLHSYQTAISQQL